MCSVVQIIYPEIMSNGQTKDFCYGRLKAFLNRLLITAVNFIVK